MPPTTEESWRLTGGIVRIELSPPSKIGHGTCHPPPSATINRTLALI
jgi:hypothetical protein